MTFAQFRRMKPIYRRRLIFGLVVVFLLFILVIFGISFGISAVSRLMNTTTIDKADASNILQRSNMNAILSVMKQEDPSKVLVIDCSGSFAIPDGVATGTESGKTFTLKMKLLNLVDSNNAQYWELNATEKKATLSRVSSEYKNLTSLTMRKVTFQDYYPALSRVTSPSLMRYLNENIPAGNGGTYYFADNFDNNLEPAYSPYITDGLRGVWVPKVGDVSEFGESYVPVNRCAPLLLSVEAVDEAKSSVKRVTLLPKEEVGIILLESGTY